MTAPPCHDRRILASALPAASNKVAVFIHSRFVFNRDPPAFLKVDGMRLIEIIAKCRVCFSVPGCHIEGSGIVGVVAVIVLAALVTLAFR